MQLVWRSTWLTHGLQPAHSALRSRHDSQEARSWSEQLTCVRTGCKRPMATRVCFCAGLSLRSLAVMLHCQYWKIMSWCAALGAMGESSPRSSKPRHQLDDGGASG